MTNQQIHDGLLLAAEAASQWDAEKHGSCRLCFFQRGHGPDRFNPLDVPHNRGKGAVAFKQPGELPTLANYKQIQLDIGGNNQYICSVKITLQIQLLPDVETGKRLKETVERFNEAANWLAVEAHARRIANKIALQKLFYFELRAKFALPADTAIRCIAQVVETYKRDKKICPRFRPHAAVPFSMKKNISFKGADRVSISTLNGRAIVPYIMGSYQRERFGLTKGQCDLVLRRDDKWFLLVTVDIPDGTPTPTNDFIGVDFGSTNILVDSDKTIHSSAKIEAKRIACFSLRKSIGQKTRNSKRTTRRSCHRKIIKIGNRESNYRKDVNHCIAKELVAKAKGTNRGIAIENLKGIRDRTLFRKQQRAKMSGWSFAQLRSFIEYKAKVAGVKVIVVDPRNTSRTCSECGHCEKGNRKSQSEFECLACGHKSLADFNAARNIRAKALVSAPIESEQLHIGAA